MQEISRAVAEDQAFWTDAVAREVREIFDSRADGWHTHESDEYLAPLAAALDELGVAGRICLDVGAATAIQELTLRSRFAHVALLDISAAMLANADPQRGARLRADANRLPIATGSVDAVVCVNMFLFADEYLRVLAEDGCLVFVSTRGSSTPIYLAPEDFTSAVARRSHSPLETTTGAAAYGLWTVARRVKGAAR